MKISKTGVKSKRGGKKGKSFCLHCFRVFKGYVECQSGHKVIGISDKARPPRRGASIDKWFQFLCLFVSPSYGKSREDFLTALTTLEKRLPK